MLIGLNGRKQAGKDTVFARAAHLMADVYPVERVSFADRLYESVAAALGVTVADLQEWKADPEVRVTVARVGADYDGQGVPFRFHRTLSRQSIREYLQHYGTEAHRDVFGPDFWVDNVDLSHDLAIVMVTDVRFKNEAQAVQNAGGTVVQVVGPPEVEDTGDGHASEAPLPDSMIDARLDNSVRNDGFRSLDEQVSALICRLLRGASGVRPQVFRP